MGRSSEDKYHTMSRVGEDDEMSAWKVDGK